MSNFYEIFTDLEDAEQKLAKINIMFGYPNGAETYRKHHLHPDENDNRVVGIVDERLIEVCAAMSEQERSEYYEQANLKTLQEISALGWFIDEEL